MTMNLNIPNKRTLLCTLVAAALHSGSAWAQEAPSASEETEEQAEDAFEQIVITASRRAESLQEAPATISVLDESTIDSMRVDGMDSLTDVVPGLSLQGSHRDQNRIGMRGAFSSADTPSSGQAVGLFVDGVYYGRSASMGPVLFDMERIEILRGPQGTLYGPNVVGGLINIQTRDPSLSEYEGRVQASYGRFGLLELGGRVSMPLIEDELGVAVTVTKSDSDGWLENQVTGEKISQIDTTSLRVKTLWVPNIDWRIEAFAEFFNDETYGESRILLPLDGEPERFVAPKAFDQTLIAKDATYDRDVYTFGLSLDYYLSDFTTFTSITSYHEADSLVSDAPFLAGPVEFIGVSRDSTVETFTQELRLFGENEGGTFRWQTGLYYYDDTSSTPEIFESIQAPNTPILEFGFPEYFVSTHVMSNDTESLSVFAQFTYELTDWINVTVGGRYVDESKDSFVETSGDAFPGNFAIEEIFTLTQSESWNQFTPKFGIDAIQRNVGGFDSILYFASVTKGFKSGDFVKSTTLESSIGTTNPEIVWNYEGGIKTSFWDRRANANITIFNTDYQDLQTQILTETGFTRVVTNDATAQGVEVMLSAMPTDALTLSATYAYLDTDIESDDPGVDGNQLPMSPENSYSVQATYTWEFEDADMAFTAVYTNQDAMYIDVDNVEPAAVHNLTKQSILNMDLTVFYQNWEFSVWGKNLLDDEMIVEANDLTGFWSYSNDEFFGEGKEQFWNAKPSMPRSFGVTAKWRF